MHAMRPLNSTLDPEWIQRELDVLKIADDDKADRLTILERDTEECKRKFTEIESFLADFKHTGKIIWCLFIMNV